MAGVGDDVDVASDDLGDVMLGEDDLPVELEEVLPTIRVSYTTWHSRYIHTHS